MTVKYHINKNGSVKECKAQSVETCTARGLNGRKAEHFNNKQEAKIKIEEELNKSFGKNFTISKKKKCENVKIDTFSKEQLDLEEKYFRNLLQKNKLENIDSPETKALKALNAQDLGKVLINIGEKEGFKEDIYKAIKMATILHKDQTRMNRGEFEKTPYIEHPLRNAVRISRWGIKDKNILNAAVLHDTIEDGSSNYVKLYENEEMEESLISRERLSKEIEKRFGKETLRLVQAVSNDYQDSETKTNQTLQEKSDIYKKHVENSLKDASVYLVKIADFVDNATGLYHNDRPERRASIYKRAYKYIPLVDVFQKRINLLNGKIDKENIQKIEEQLKRTKIRLEKLVDRGM